MGVAFGGAIMAVRQNHYLSRGLSGEAAGAAGNRIYLAAQRDAFLFGLCIVALAILFMSRVPDIKKDSIGKNYK